jgi:hypothetical protein
MDAYSGGGFIPLNECTWMDGVSMGFLLEAVFWVHFKGSVKLKWLHKLGFKEKWMMSLVGDHFIHPLMEEMDEIK